MRAVNQIVEQDWIVLEVPVEPMDPWSAIRLNSRLTNARLVGSTRVEGAGLGLRGEVRPDTTARSGTDLRRARAGLEQALAVLAETEAPQAGDVRPAEPVKVETAEVDAVSVDLGPLGERLETTGWSFRENAGGELSVDLAVPGQSTRAAVRAGTPGMLRVSTPIVRDPVDTALARWSVGRFLLAATSGLRRVRPSASSERTVDLEVDLPQDAADGELDICLGALAFASQTLSREVDLLAKDEGVAVAYATLLADEFTPVVTATRTPTEASPNPSRKEQNHV